MYPLGEHILNYKHNYYSVLILGSINFIANETAEMQALRKFDVGVIGASGSVGGQVTAALLRRQDIGQIRLFGRRELSEYKDDERVSQLVVPMEVGKFGGIKTAQR